MVFAIMLSHGRYSKEVKAFPDIKVPYNIRLITYTYPGKALNPIDVDYNLSQILDKHIPEKINTGRKESVPSYIYSLKPEILTIDQDNSTFEVKNPPFLKRKSIRIPYPANDRRVIGEEFEPQGKYRIYEPNGTTPNVELEFNTDIKITKSGKFTEPHIVKQTRTGSEMYNYRVHTQNSLGYFLKELSCFYEKEFPGKVVNVLQLGCRGDHEYKTMSVDELADDFENKLTLRPREIYKISQGIFSYNSPDVRPGLEGYSRGTTSDAVYNSSDFEYIFKYPSFIIRKSEDISLPLNSDCLEKNAYYNYKIGGIIRSRNKRSRNKRSRNKRTYKKRRSTRKKLGKKIY